MKRRDAIKGLGLSLGYAITAPTVVGMLQSCTADAPSWQPVFLNQSQGQVLTQLIDIILPKTEATPGASEVNVPQFLDLYISKAYTKDRQDGFLKGLNAIMSELGVKGNGKVKVSEATYKSFLDKYLKASKEDQEGFSSDESAQTVFQSISQIRDAAVWAYKTSEMVGEQVMSYDPVPGAYLGCIPVSDVGNAWSL